MPVLENHAYRVEIAPQSGAIRRILDKQGALELIGEPRLAENFRLLLPLPGMEANYIIGTQQGPPEIAESGSALALRWPGPLRSACGSFDLSTTLHVELAGAAVQFRITVVNRTPHTLAEVWYPVLGGLQGLGPGEERLETTVFVPQCFTQWTQELFRDFAPGRESLGCLSPEHAFVYPGYMSMPWCSFYNRSVGRGFYFASHDPVARARVLRLAMHPGAAFGRLGSTWPTAQELGGRPAGVTMNWAFMPYARPGETFEGAPVVLQCHEGDWRRSAELYRGWFAATFPLVDSRNHWLRRATEFQATMFMLPEDNINLTYADIPRWAKAASDCGVRSVLICGWQVGGHDRGYPQYEPDPRLGTWEELEAGVRACHQMGLRVYFFANVQPADITTQWYRDELHRYIIMDRWGNPCYFHGWGMGTLSARLGVTRVNSTDMNPAHPEVRQIILRYARRLAEIGADGIHFDKLFGHPLDFNPRLSTSPDRAVHEGVLQCIEEVLTECRRINPEFCISYENHWDRLISYSDVCWWCSGLSALKFVFPQWAGTLGLTQPWSFNQANQAVLCGHFIMVGAANYMRGMDYEPMLPLCRYVGEIARIRRELHGVLSRGRVLEASQEPFVLRPSAVDLKLKRGEKQAIGWTLFEDVDAGRRALVVANLALEPVEIALELQHPAGSEAQLWQPFRPTETRPWPVVLSIPPERFAVVVDG